MGLRYDAECDRKSAASMSARVPRSPDRPRIGLDVGPARTPAAGVSVYVTELARALDRIAPERVSRLGVRPDGPVAEGGEGGPVSRQGGHGYLVWLQLAAERHARAAGCDLVHYTNGVAPLRTSLPFVLTIHDLALLRRPSQHPVTRLARVPFTVLAARCARLVITPSQATASDVRRLLHITASRVVVIPDAGRLLAAGPGDQDVVGRLGLVGCRFILSLGTIEPRKNGVGLLGAFERLAADDPALRLVFAGGAGWRDGVFRRALAASPARDRVTLAGHLSDGELAALIGACAVMAYPSFQEGFGLPILEAMALGAPVVTSRVSSMPEVAGGAAVLVDPTDVGSIAAGIGEAMTRRDALSTAGRARAASRTWLDVGRETLAAYDRVLARAE
jgi:glycosyltransferase involved in cell wall biosynthesis